MTDRSGCRKSELKLLETIIESIMDAGEMSSDDWLKLSPNALIPYAIPVSIGKEYRATPKGVKAAYDLTSQIRREREDFRQTVVKEVFERLSFNAIGSAIRNVRTRRIELVDEHAETAKIDEQFFQELSLEFHETLSCLIEKARRDSYQHFACTLFREDQMVPEFSVGSVVFRPRSVWIEHCIQDAETRRIVGLIEAQELDIAEVRRRASVMDGEQPFQHALDVISFLREFSWVGTIRVNGHDLLQAHRKMSVIAGLAFDTVGLLFHADAARRFVRADRAHLDTEDRLATSVDDGKIIYGWSRNVPGLGSKPGSLREKIESGREFLDASGTILCAYAESRQVGRAPHLVEAWVNALHWIGEARREVSDFMAVVNYGCALDILSNSDGKLHKITEFVKAGLAPTEGDGLIEERKLRISQLVKLVYLEGRSKLLHGNLPGVLEHLDEARRVGDYIATNLICQVTPILAKFIEVKSTPVITENKKVAFRILKNQLLVVDKGP